MQFYVTACKHDTHFGPLPPEYAGGCIKSASLKEDLTEQDETRRKKILSRLPHSSTVLKQRRKHPHIYTLLLHITLPSISGTLIMRNSVTEDISKLQLNRKAQRYNRIA